MLVIFGDIVYKVHITKKNIKNFFYLARLMKSCIIVVKEKKICFHLLQKLLEISDSL